MTILASDGLEYADITQRLLGNPLDNWRNHSIRQVRSAGYGASEVRAYLTGYDHARGRHSDKSISGWKALDKERARANKSDTPQR